MEFSFLVKNFCKRYPGEYISLMSANKEAKTYRFDECKINTFLHCKFLIKLTKLKKSIKLLKELFEKDHIVDSNVKLRACIKNGIYYQELVRILIGVCGLQVNIDSVDERGEVVLEISGDVASEDVSLAINMLAPHAEELLDFSTQFSDGINGIMQIITVIEIDEALRRRRF